MPAIKYNIQAFGESAFPGIGTTGNIPRFQNLQAGTSKRTKAGYRFLKTTFLPKKSGSVLPVFGRENYEYLYQSAVNYSKLVDSSLLPSKDYNVPNLFCYMKGLLLERQDMTIIQSQDTGEVSFYLYYDTDFLWNKQYYVPCNIVHKTKGRFQKIIINLLLCLKSEGVSFPLDQWDYESIIYDCEWHCKHTADPDNLSEEDLEIKSIFENFKDGGKVDTLFRSLDNQKGNLEDLKKLIRKYKPVGAAEANIISLIKRGIPLMEKSSFRSYMRDAYDQLHEDRDLEDEFDDEGYEIYTMEQLLRFVYDTEDKVTQSLQQQVYDGMYNSSFEIYVDHIPATEIVLKPDTGKPLLPRSSELLYWWLEELISALEKFGKKDLITVFENYDKEN